MHQLRFLPSSSIHVWFLLPIMPIKSICSFSSGSCFLPFPAFLLKPLFSLVSFLCKQSTRSEHAYAQDPWLSLRGKYFWRLAATFGQVNLLVRWGEQGSQSSSKKQLQCSAVGIKPLGCLNFQAEKPQESRWTELELEQYTKMAVECKGENGGVTLPYCPVVETH